MSKAMVSLFDQFPEYNGQSIEIRGKDGYVSVSPHVRDWTKEEFERGLRFNRDDTSELYQ